MTAKQVAESFKNFKPTIPLAWIVAYRQALRDKYRTSFFQKKSQNNDFIEQIAVLKEKDGKNT
jgi:hypothetical protein